MAKIKKLIGGFLLTAIMLSMTHTVIYAQEDILTLDKAISDAYDYSLINEKQNLLQRDWDEQLNRSKGQVTGINQLIELDDDIRKAKEYLESEDYRSMRIDIVREDSIDFLLMYGYISYMDYLLIKGGFTENDLPIMAIFNDDEILKKYYEFQLKYMPEALPSKSRIDMLSAQASSVTQMEALIKQEKAKLEAEKAKLRIDVVKAYTDLIIADKHLNNARNNEDETRKVVTRYSNLHRHGMISSLEYKEAEAELENKKNARIKAERELDKCKTILRALTGRDENTSIVVDDTIKTTEELDISFISLKGQLERENINLFVLRETMVGPSTVRFEIASKELKPEDKLYKEIQDEKDKAEMEYFQVYDKYKEAVIQQIRAIRKTQSSAMEIQRNMDLIEQKITLVKAQIEAGFATDLDLLRLQNTFNSLKTDFDNLRYVLEYQQQNLQYTVHY